MKKYFLLFLFHFHILSQTLPPGLRPQVNLGNSLNQQQGQQQDDEIEREEVILGIDKIIQLDFPADPRIEIGNEAILNYTFIPTKQQITLKGIRGGESSVTIRDRVGDIRKKLIVTVTATDQARIVKKLRGHLKDVEGLEISIVEGDVVVGGLIYVPNDIGKVVAILSREEYQNVIRLVELAPQTQLLVARRMQEEIQNAGHKDVTVRIVNGVFVLEGIVTQENAKTEIVERAKLLLPDRIENLAQQFQAVQSPDGATVILDNVVFTPPKEKPQPIPKLIKITAQFVELARDYNKIFGFAWRPLLSGSGGHIAIGRETQRGIDGIDGITEVGGITTDSSQTLSATISNLFPKLNSAKSANYAKVIRSGVVITEADQQATISKEATHTIITPGETPLQTNIVTGFNVSVTPRILEKENIRLQGLNVKISTTDSSNASGARTRNDSVTTNLIVKSRESAVIGGVVQKSNNTSYDRDYPGAGDVIEDGEGGTGGSLFSFVRSKNHVKTNEQFVVFITPEIIESPSEGVQEIRRKFRTRGR